MIWHPFFIAVTVLVNISYGGLYFLKGKWKIYVKMIIEIVKSRS